MLNTRARSCPVCGSGDESHVFAAANFDSGRLDEFSFASRKLPEYMHPRLIACPICDLVYANPAIQSETLADAYAQAAFDSGKESRFAAATYARLLRPVLPRLPNQEGALDIGAGDGTFLRELLRAGFHNVTGVEPSHAPVEAAEEDVRPLLRLEMFDSQRFTPGSLSLATCFQTIEHVDDPLALCRNLWQLLRSGGAVMLVGHNRRAFSAKCLGRRSPIFDIEHLQLFSPRSFRELLSRSGFRDVTVTPIVNRYPLSYWVRLFPFPAGIKTALAKVLERTGAGRLSVPLPAGNLLAIGWKSEGVNPTQSTSPAEFL